MLNNLVESGSHAATHNRRSRFFLGTLLSYAALLLLAAAASIYAYDSHLAAENFQHIEWLLAPPDKIAPGTPKTAPQPASVVNDAPPSVAPPRVIERTTAIAPTTDPTKVPDTISTTRNTVPSAPPDGIFRLGDENTSNNLLPAPNASGARGNNASNSSVSATTGTRANITPPPLPPVVARAEPKKRTPLRVSIGVLKGSALVLPQPVYPLAARQLRLGGTVTVQIVIDEKGKVVSAHAVGGHALLRPAAVRAALAARFKPTLLSNEPVSVQGIINYQFRVE